MIVPTITLLDSLNFYLLFKFDISIYKKQIVPTSHMMMVPTSHLMKPIEWVPSHKRVSIF